MFALPTDVNYKEKQQAHECTSQTEKYRRKEITPAQIVWRSLIQYVYPYLDQFCSKRVKKLLRSLQRRNDVSWRGSGQRKDGRAGQIVIQILIPGLIAHNSHGEGRFRATTRFDLHLGRTFEELQWNQTDERVVGSIIKNNWLLTN